MPWLSWCCWSRSGRPSRRSFPAPRVDHFERVSEALRVATGASRRRASSCSVAIAGRKPWPAARRRCGARIRPSRRGGERGLPGLARAWPRAPAARQAFEHSAGISKGRNSSPAPCGAGDFLGAERRAVHLVGAGLVRRAEADDGLGRRSASAVGLLRAQRGGDRFRIMAVERERVPAGGLRSGRPGRSNPTARRLPSIVMPLSSHSTISLLSLRWPASVIASWLMPSIRQPSPAST
jgi:hypothetical protein